MEWLLIAAALVVGVPAAAWLAQDRLIFFPQRIESTAHLPQRAQPLTLAAADGTRLAGWIVPGEASPAPTVIYFGGNAEEVSWTLADGRWPRAFNLVAFNYRGYGTSQGKPSAAALLADGLAIHDAVAARPDVDAARLVVFGRSLGTAAAAHVASERNVAGAILVSPYDSLAAVGSHHYPLLPVSLLLRHRFVPVEDAARARGPLLVIVADSDSIIPPARSQALFDAWAGPKEWIGLPRVDHNTLGATREFWDAIGRFLGRR
ncbi:MAG: alpha/beta hydrolase [Burkholderiales bacterium]|nr:alpha/beta hydrolase [Burkholderiales bacterium]